VACLLPGVRNGKRIGIILSIVARNVEEIRIQAAGSRNRTRDRG